MNENRLKSLHSTMQKRDPQFTVSFADFAKDMQDENRLKSLYSNIQKRDPDFTISYEDFKKDMGFSGKASPAKKEKTFWGTGLGDTLENIGSGIFDLAGNAYGVLDKGAQAIESVLPDFMIQKDDEGNSLRIFDRYSKENKALAASLAQKGDAYDGKGSIELWKEGRYLAAINKASNEALKSLPTSGVAIAAAMAGAPFAGLGAIGTLAASAKYDSLNEDDATRDMPEHLKVTNAVLTGAGEAASELIGDIPITGMIVRAYKIGGRTAAERAIRGAIGENIVKKIGTKLADYDLILAPFEEGVSEIAAQMSENVVDKVTGVDLDVNVTDGVAEAFIYGAAGGAQFSIVAAPGKIKNAVDHRNAVKYYTDSEKNIKEKLGDKSAAWIDRVNQVVASGDNRQVHAIFRDLSRDASITEEQKAAILQYLNAGKVRSNADAEYKKLLDGKRKEAEEKATELINATANPVTGTVMTGVVLGVKGPVNIHSGLVFNEDGSINREESDSQLIYSLPGTGERKVTTLDHLEKMMENIPFEDAMQQAVHIATAPITAQEENDGVREYEKGETVRFNPDGGNMFLMGKITETDEMGNYTVEMEMPGGMQRMTIEPRMIVNEDNIRGVDNGSLVEYRNEKGETVQGEVEDAHGYRLSGQMVIDNVLVNIGDIVGLAPSETAKQEKALQRNPKYATLNDKTLNQNLSDLDAAIALNGDPQQTERFITERDEIRAELENRNSVSQDVPAGREGDVTTLPQNEVVSPAGQESRMKEIITRAPKQKNGEIDYDALREQSPEDFAVLYENEEGEEETRNELTSVSENMDKLILAEQEKLKNATSINAKKEAKKNIAALTGRKERIDEVINSRYTTEKEDENNNSTKINHNEKGNEKELDENVPHIPLTFDRNGFKGDFLNEYEFLAEGSESTVYLSKDKKNVIKIGEPYNAPSTFRERVRTAMTINKLLGDGSLRLIGYYESRNGTKNPIFEQKYIEGKTLSENEVVEHLKRKGYVKEEGSNVGAYSITIDGKKYIVSDFLDNFKRDSKGNVFAIDLGLEIIDIEKGNAQEIDTGLSALSSDLSVDKDTNNDTSPNENETKINTEDTDNSGQGREINPTVSFTEQQATQLVEVMETNAVEAPQLELTPENWYAEFGIEGTVETPLGRVKMGENQYLKLQANKREGQFGMIKSTLTNPDVVIEEESRENAVVNDRETSLLYVKTFKDENGNKFTHFENVTVSKNKKEVVVSNHIIRSKQLLDKLKAGRVVYTATALDASGQTSAEYTSQTESGAPSADKNTIDNSNTNENETEFNSNEPERQSGNETEEVSEESNPGATPGERLAESGGDIIQLAQEQAKNNEISEAEKQVNINPSEAQKKAGNYKKGHITVQGFDISIEQPKGSVRSGVDGNGKKWKTKMNNPYGYIRGTEGKDRDHIDVFLGENPLSEKIFVVDQVNPETGEFDEHKVMLGFNDINEAASAYMSNYETGWQGLDDITETGIEDFREWSEMDGRRIKPFSEYKSNQGNNVRLQAEQTDDLEPVNERFNEELQQQIDGTLPKGHTYKIGNPSDILQSAGIPNLPIELQSSRLSDKSMQENHPFDLSEVKDLPKAIQNPLAVFDSATMNGSFVILTEMEHNGKNFVVAIEANRKKGSIEINDIRSIHYRTSNVHIANWINNNLTRYADKQKLSEWFSKQRYNSAEVKGSFTRAAKIVQEFENSKLPEEKSHVSNKKMRPVSRKAWNKLIRLLKKSGLARNVFTDKAKMRGYLETHLGKEGAERFMMLWHGSPHAFKKFSTAFMGSGEGAQAYGWGLYFTDKKEIAETYARNNAPEWSRENSTINEFAKDTLADFNGNKNEAVAYLSSLLHESWSDKKRIRKAIKILETGKELKVSGSNLYNVKIHGDKTADELNLMRWDKPLSDEQMQAIHMQMEKEIGTVFPKEHSTLSHGVRLYYGVNVYEGLKDLFQSKKAASEFLLRAGFDGIQYPSEYSTKGSHEDSFNYVVFDENVIDIQNRIRLMATPKGEVYGFVTPEGDIYLDSDRMNANTPVHEFGHLWNNFIEKANPELWGKGKALIKQSPYWREVNNNPSYAHLSEDGKIDEALAMAIGDKGEAMFESGDILGISRLRTWLNEVWDFIKGKLFRVNLNSVDIESMSLDDYTTLAVKELTKDKKLPFSRSHENGSVKTQSEVMQIESPVGTLGDHMQNADFLPRTTGLPVNKSQDKGTTITENNKQSGDTKQVGENSIVKEPAIETQLQWKRESDVVSNMPEGERLPMQEDGITSIERVLSEQKGITFMGDPLTGKAKIKTAQDVAFLFKNLESAASENVFVVLHRPDGTYSVLYLSTGTSNQSFVDIKQIAAAAKEFKASSVTLVHNHPSGALIPSTTDKMVHAAMTQTLGVDVNPSVIINLDSGKFGVFNQNEGEEVHKKEQSKKFKKAKVYQFDRLKLYETGIENHQIRSSEDIARFLSRHKRGTADKMHVLVLNSQNIITRYALLPSDLNRKELALKLVEEAGKHGNSIILSSNAMMNESDLRGIAQITAKAGVKLLDSLTVKQDSDIISSYISAADEGILSENSAMPEKNSVHEVNTGTDPQRIAANAIMPRSAKTVSEAQDLIRPLVGKPITNSKLGITGTISGNSLGKLGSESATEKSISPALHAKAIANIDVLFQNAEFDVTHPDEKGVYEVEKIHRLGSLMFDEASGEYIPVMLTVKEFNNPKSNRIYTIETVDIEAKEKSAGQLVVDRQSPLQQTPIADFTNHESKEDAIHDFNAKIQQLIETVKQSGKKSSENSNTNGSFAENNNDNNEISDRSAQAQQRGGNEVHSREQEIADRLRRGIEANEKKLKGHERQDAEKRIVFDYAKEKGLWIDDVYSLGKPTGIGGNENTLALDEETGTIYKSNNLFNSKDLISNLLGSVRIHNELFPETKYELVGFTGIDNGKNRTPYVEAILKQDYVPDVEQASPQEISDYMQSIGFRRVDEHTFTNGKYTVSDLRPRNVLKDRNGTIYVVDDIISENKSEDASNATDDSGLRFQVVPSSGNTGSGDFEYTAEERAALEHRLKTTAFRIGGFRIPTFRSFRKGIQDSMLPVRDWMESLVKSGMEIMDADNFYMNYTAMSGKIDERMKFFKNAYSEPLVKSISRLMEHTGEDYTTVGYYAMLKHIPERTAWQRKRVEEKFLTETQPAIEKEFLEKHPNPTEAEKAVLQKMIQDEKTAKLKNLPDNGLRAIVRELQGMEKDEKLSLEDATRLAQEFIAEFESRAGGQYVDEFWGNVRKANEFAQEERFKGGLKNREQIENLKNLAEFYVPLKGHALDTAEDAYDYGRGGNDVFFTPNDKRAKGRTSIAEDPFAYIFSAAQSAVHESINNHHMQQVYRLARRLEKASRDNNGKPPVTVERTWFVKSGDKWVVADEVPYPDDPGLTPEQAEEKYREDVEAENLRMKELAERGEARRSGKEKLDLGGMFIKPADQRHHDVHVFVNGVMHTIRFHGTPEVARAINKANRVYADRSNNFTGAMVTVISKITRFLSSMYTTFRPAFVMFTNPTRDVRHLSRNLYVKEGAKYAGRALLNYGEALRFTAAYVAGFKKQDTKIGGYYAEFIMNGGKTGLSNLVKLRDIQKEINNDLTLLQTNGFNRNLRLAGRYIVSAFTALSEGTENVARFAAYLTSREMGRTVQRSISDAKEVTVNFNRKGSGAYGGAEMRAMYAFVNVGFQGLQQYVHNWKAHTGRMAVAAAADMAIGAILMPVLNNFLSRIGGDDEEKWLEEFARLPDHVRNNNTSFWTGKGFIHIPLSQEYRAHYALGTNFFMMMNGKADAKKMGEELGIALLELIAYNPILDAAEGSAADIFSTSVVPVAQLVTNKSFTGSPIYNSWQDENSPLWAQVRTSKKGEPYAPKPLINFFRFLDGATGGDGVKPGTANFDPDKWNHILNGYVGAIYKPLMHTLEVISGDKEWQSMLISKSVYTPEDKLPLIDAYSDERYYDFSTEVKTAAKHYDRYVDNYFAAHPDSDVEDFLRYMEKNHAKEFHLIPLEDYPKEIKKLEGTLKGATPDEQRGTLEEIAALKYEFLDAYYETKSKYE